MLKQISIKNFALIGSAELSFSDGLTALSGETGAGKTLLVSALHLAAGGRAGSDMVGKGGRFAQIVAVFAPPAEHPAFAFLTENGINDADGEIIVRRSIDSEGKSKSFVCDAPVGAALLKSLGEHLVDISGQREHQKLLHEANHLEILDEFGGLSDEREAFRALYKECRRITEEIDALKKEAAERAGREDYIRFQLEELASLGLTECEDEALERERALLRNAEKIAQSCREIENSLYQNDVSAAALAAKARKAAETARALGLEKAAEITSAIADAEALLTDAARAAGSLSGRIESNPGRLDAIEERLSAIYRVAKKHGGSAAKALEKKAQMEAELSRIKYGGENISALEAALKEKLESLGEAAAKLGAKRVKAAAKLSKAAESHLRELAMPRARFEAELTPIGEGSDAVNAGGRLVLQRGAETCRFLFCANAGGDMAPLAKTASGGELSRTMLALKRALIETSAPCVLLFDEIDAGVGGEAAVKIAQKLKSLSRKRQTLCVTHLAQIAAKADAQIVVSKSNSGERAETTVRLLSDEERVTEIARMLSGSPESESALAHARELLFAKD